MLKAPSRAIYPNLVEGKETNYTDIEAENLMNANYVLSNLITLILQNSIMYVRFLIRWMLYIFRSNFRSIKRKHQSFRGFHWLPSLTKTYISLAISLSENSQQQRDHGLPHSIRADHLATTASPDALLSHRRTSMRRINHPSSLHENTYMLHRAGRATVTVLTPEDQVSRLSLGARDVLAHAGMILRVGGARNLLVQGLADGVLRQAWEFGG